MKYFFLFLFLINNSFAIEFNQKRALPTITDVGGNIGLGDSSPSEVLNVSGNVAVSSGSLVIFRNDGDTDTRSSIAGNSQLMDFNGDLFTLSGESTTTIGGLEGFLFLMVNENNDGCIYTVSGAQGSSIEVADPTAICSATSGTNNSINIFTGGGIVSIANLNATSVGLTLFIFRQ